MTENTRVEFSDELIDILGEIGTTDTVAFELLWMTDPKTEYHNGLGIKHLDVSEEDWCFSATLKNGNRYDMKIGKFIRYFFPGMFGEDDINAFCKAYNSIKDGEATDDGDIIDTSKVSMDPKDPRSAFLSLVTKTYPHGHEEEVFALLPPGLSKDSVGNYYKIIGASPKVMFTSHLDTADRAQKETQLYSIKENGEEYVITDGSSILGADDKAGVAVMLYMMAHGIPGLYYFFIGEERGGIGSRALAKIFGEVAHLKGITRCVSFDRRNYHSVITSQLGSRCCSDEFAEALCKEYNKNGLSLSPDATGIYTDSASFMEDIPECTNVSVGYFDEHTGGEYQNITYLEKLCEASLKVDWAALPVHRKIGLDDTVIKKNEKLISALKKASYMLDHKIVCDEGKTYFRIDLEAAYIDDAHDCLELVLRVLQSFKRSTDVVLENTHIKIELN